VLTQTYATVNARLQALRFRSNQDEAKWQRAVLEHERMVDALAARDGAALRRRAGAAPAAQARRGARADARGSRAGQGLQTCKPR
jgi:DNA-binding GntR family transcriptional regulator